MRVREQRQTLEALSEVSRALASALSLPEFFFLAIRATARAIGAFKGNIWRYDEAAGRAGIEASYNISPEQIDVLNQRLRALPSGQAPVLQSMQSRQVVMVPDFMRDERYAELREWAQEWGLQSALYAPLVYGNRTIGSLALYFPEPMTFDENDALFLETVAAQVATAMVANEHLNALQHVNEDLVHRQEELEVLSSQSAQYRLLQLIIEELPAGITFLDDELRIRLANPAFQHALGATLEQIQDCPVSAVAGAGAAELEGVLRRVMATGEPFHADMFAFTLKGRPELGTRYWDLTCLPLSNIMGGLEGVLVLSLDVTERHAYLEGIQRQVRELKALDDMKDNFLAIVSHELRTPLNFITGFASILEDEIMGSLTPEQHTYLQRILEGADRLLEIITNMLIFNRLQSGKVTLFPERLEIDVFASDLAERLRPKAQEKGLALTCEMTADLPSVCVDAESLERVLNQLVDNAIKFTPEGGRITVRGRKADKGKVRIEVADTGIGIAEAVIPKLFTRFFQADMSPTRQFGGTGLGLAISKRLMELLHGEIGVESELGKGSTFWIQLPVAGAECH